MTQQLSNNTVKWFADKCYQKVENLGFDQRKQNTTYLQHSHAAVFVQQAAFPNISRHNC